VLDTLADWESGLGIVPHVVLGVTPLGAPRVAVPASQTAPQLDAERAREASVAVTHDCVEARHSRVVAARYGLSHGVPSTTRLSSHFVQRELAQSPQWLVGSPRYLTMRGAPDHVDELREHHFVLRGPPQPRLSVALARSLPQS
jgi:hypothetical protein